MFWWIWSEVRDYLGEDEWKSVDVSWMPARARTDLGRVSTSWRHEDPYLLAGLWRLGLERETVLELLAAHDGEAAWPLATPESRFPLGRGNHFPFLWRPRLERWYRAQPAGETAAERLKGKLGATWAVAVATKDVGLAATVVEALDERFGPEAAEERASDALDLVRETVSSLGTRIRVDPREHWGRVPTALMERIGVPGEVDLTTIVDWARGREKVLGSEAIPLPHPYDLHLCVLRLQRLRDRGPTHLPMTGVIRDERGQPIPAVWIEVEGYPRPNSSPPAWRTDAQGRFRIDDIPRGPAKLLVTTGKWSPDAKKRVVETRAGVSDLVVVLDPGPQLLLRVVGYVPGPQGGWARVTWNEPDGVRSVRQVRHAPIRDDGWVRFVALPPDRELEVWADAEINRRIVRARGLRPGESEHRIEPEEVQDIAGRVRVSREFRARKTAQWQEPLREDHFTVEVHAHPDFLVARTRVRNDGSFRVHGLPPGVYVVSAAILDGDRGDPPRATRVEAGTTDLVIDFE